MIFPKENRSSLAGVELRSLRILSYAGHLGEPGRRRHTYRCLCLTCDRVFDAYEDNLSRGKISDCGCGRAARQADSHRKNLPPGMAGLLSLYRRYRDGARRRGRAFDLTLQQFAWLTQQPCHYCSLPPSNTHIPQSTRSVSGYGNYVHSGIDRVDQLLGYVAENVVPCCTPCNDAKSTGTLLDFAVFIARHRSLNPDASSLSSASAATLAAYWKAQALLVFSKLRKMREEIA